MLLLADMVASLPAHDLTLHTDPHANAEGHQEEQNRQSERAAALLWEMSVVDAYEPVCSMPLYEWLAGPSCGTESPLAGCIPCNAST